MFEGAYTHPESYATETTYAEALQATEAVVATPSHVETDPEAVIEFLLKKIEEQDAQFAAKLAEQEAFTELVNQELEQVRGQLQVTREELDRNLADYEVMMQNALATEQELEGYKQKATEKPRISLPFHTEQKLAKLGWSESAPAAADLDRVAV